MTGLALRFPQTPDTPYFSRLILSRLMRLADPLNSLPRFLSMPFYCDAAAEEKKQIALQFRIELLRNGVNTFIEHCAEDPDI